MEEFSSKDQGGNRKLPVFRIVLIVAAVALAIGFVSGSFGGLIGGTFSESHVMPWLEENLGLSIIPKVDIEDREQIMQIIEDSATVQVVEKSSPSVVSIVITKELDNIKTFGPSNIPFDFFGFEWPFFEPSEESDSEEPMKREIGGGTGFIVTDDGLIVTNRHVVTDQDAEYTVVLSDGTKYPAEVLAQDAFLDLAIIKIEAESLPILELGDSDDLKIGQTVIAIGNALTEYQNTVTRGVVSGINRRVVAGDQYGRSEVIEEAIQTDAAINPGNSGGPLLNLAGQVVGVNTAMSEGAQSVGFAIPINSAKKIVESVREHGRIVRPWIGVRYMILNESIAKENNISVDYGALVVRGRNPEELAIIPGSPADKAGLLENDIILEVEGEQINEENPLGRIINKYSPGDTVTLKILSKGEEKDMKVTLEEYNKKE